MWVLGLTEDLETRVLERKPREAPREQRHVPRKTGDGACRDCGSVTVVAERIGKAIFKKGFQAFTTCNYCIAVREKTFSTAAVGKRKKYIHCDDPIRSSNGMG